MPGRESLQDHGFDIGAVARPPFHLTRLIGRDREIRDVVDLVAGARLVSLVGPGGIGKTRLAAAVAETRIADADHGSGWVDLASLDDPELLPRHVAAALGLRAHSRRDPGEALIERIGPRPYLLVLDNCEHLLGAAARLTERLLRACPSVRILTTSREALGVPGEKVWRVKSLEVPDADAAGVGGDDGSQSSSFRDLAEAPAVRLFAERAEDVVPSFELTEANLPSVARICRRLDGLPLAIELAAARAAVLPPEQLADRLDDVFRVLASRSDSMVPRHRTLRAVMDWSYALLTEPERYLFDRLAVFVGGFTLEAVERVVADPEVVPEDEVLDALAALVDRSLVVMTESHGQARYSLLETVRQYSLERLGGAAESGNPPRGRSAASDADPDVLRRLHAEYHADLVEDLSACDDPGGRLTRFARIQAEHDNVRVALAWALDNDRPDLALRLCLGMQEVWRLRGFLSEGLTWVLQAISAAEQDPGLDPLRCRALVTAAVFGRLRGDYAALQEWIGEAVTLARRTGQPGVLADALTRLGVSHRDRGDLKAARESLDEALSLGREAGDSRALGTALGARASVALAEGDPKFARALRSEAVDVARGSGDREGEAFALIGLGEVARMEGRLEEARLFNHRCLALFEELGDDWHAAAALQNLGWIEVESGRDAEAYRSFVRCVVLFRASGNPFGLILCLFGLARLLLRAGDGEAAFVAVAAASAHAARVGGRPAAAADDIACEAVVRDVEAAVLPSTREAASNQGRAMTLSEALDWSRDRLAEGPGGTTGGHGPLRDPLRGPLPDRPRPSAASPEPEFGRSGAEPVGAPELDVRGLGPLRIFVQGRPLEGVAFGSSKPRELLLLLLCNPDGLTREQVGLAFWPESSTSAVKNSFHVTLHRLRKALGHPEWVVLEGERYRLSPGLGIDFDVLRFEVEAKASLRDLSARDGSVSNGSAETAGSVVEERLRAALELYRGDFLEGEVVGDWHLEVRDRLRRVHSDALLALADRLMMRGLREDAAAAYRALLGRDRLHEEACRGLMTCQARAGRRTDALRLYDMFRLLLQEELGAEPDPLTTALYDRLQRSEPV